VNAQLGIKIQNFPIFAGQYDEFTAEWYRMIGSTIVSYQKLNLYVVFDHDHFDPDTKLRELLLHPTGQHLAMLGQKVHMQSKENKAVIAGGL
jgi:hypothetical protein